MSKTAEKKKILIAEDDPSLREVLVEKFQGAGFEVYQAKNGAEGMDIAFSVHPDLIILDILMPKVDGLTMLSRLKEDVWGINVPVIILTNMSEYTYLEKALALGVDEYMIKSEWKLKNIVDRVRTILGVR